MIYSTYGKILARINLWAIILLEAFFGIMTALFLKRATGEHYDAGPWIEEKEIAGTTGTLENDGQPIDVVGPIIQSRTLSGA